MIRSAQAFVLSSRQEPFGIVLLEAAQLGVPIVATAVDGVPEVVIDNITGLLVTPDDPRRLADAVSRIFEDVELRRAIVAGAQARVTKTFTSRASYERYLSAMGPAFQ
jgi:glycosyltransferase involved in cell wall biosynthesis